MQGLRCWRHDSQRGGLRWRTARVKLRGFNDLFWLLFQPLGLNMAQEIA